jgi:NTP pyrophosphatase (non-canonical NTP hydrolase)
MLADELADVFLYLDLLASKCGIDLPAAIVRKFNVVSERQDFPERLP